MAKKDILVSISGEEGQEIAQTAVVSKDGRLVEFGVAPISAGQAGRVGDVFVGRVAGIFPGTQTCFVNIGLEKKAVMNASDVAQVPKYPEEGAQQGARPIETMLRTGQRVVVQVARAAAGDKGPRCTTKLSLPGKYAVLHRGAPRVAVSAKIKDHAEQTRLRIIMEDSAPEGFSLIARSDAEGAPEALVKEDVANLAAQWRAMEQRAQAAGEPALVHTGFDLYRNIAYRAMEPDVTRVVVDDKNAYRALLGQAKALNAELTHKFSLFGERYNIFAFYGVKRDIESAGRRKVWLKCGAHIVFDRTEALTAVDVNTSKFGGAASQEETALRVNLEAVVEAARQLRFRDIGGIVVIDLLRMHEDSSYRRVLDAMEEELENDRRKTTVAGITNLGLLEMTRQQGGGDIGQPGGVALLGAAGAGEGEGAPEGAPGQDGGAGGAPAEEPPGGVGPDGLPEPFPAEQGGLKFGIELESGKADGGED